MKKYIVVLSFLLFSVSWVAAQNNGNDNGHGCGSGNSWPAWVQSCLNASTPVPMPVCLKVVRDCRQWGQQNFGLNLGQMFQKYFQGEMTVDLIQTAPPSLTFRVSYGGIGITIILDDF